MDGLDNITFPEFAVLSILLYTKNPKGTIKVPGKTKQTGSIVLISYSCAYYSKETVVAVSWPNFTDSQPKCSIIPQSREKLF